MDNGNQNGGPTIVVMFLAMLLVGVIAFSTWLDNNMSEELNATAEYMRSPDREKWAEGKALTEEWMQLIKRGAD